MPRALFSTAIGLLALAATARAQTPDIDTQTFVPTTSADGFIGLPGTRTPGPLRYSLLLHGGLERRPLSFAAREISNVRAIDLRIGSYAGGELGLGGRAAVSAVLPVYYYEDVMLGDLELAGRYRLVGESSSRPDAPKDGPGLGLRALGLLPTHTRRFAGEDGARAELALLGDFQLLGAGVGGSAGYRHRFAGRQVPRLPSGSRPVALDGAFTFAAALKVPLPPVPDVTLLLELRGATDFRSAQATPLELDLGANLQLGHVVLKLGGGLGLNDGYGEPDGRVLLGVLWAPPTSDTDGDGIPDEDDECPPLPEDLDGYKDGDGCPDPDNDNDLVPDLDDLCPRDEAIEGQDLDEDGCTDGTARRAAPAAGGR